MKSLDNALLGLYTALIEDVSRFYPRDIIEWRRDLSRLRSILEARGSKFFTIDLVACGKHFDRCLSSGTFLPSKLPQQRPFKKGAVIPGLFRGLLLKVFQSDGTLRSDVDVTAVSLTRQLYYAAKKVRHDCDPKATYKAVEEFFDIEKDIPAPSLAWGADDLGITSGVDHHLGDRLPISDPLRSVQLSFNLGEIDCSWVDDGAFSSQLAIVQRVADMVACDLGELSWPEIRSKHGPGAVSDLKRGRSKYSFPNWPAKLEAVFPAVGFAISSESLWTEVLESGYPMLSLSEPPSRLIAVPKTQKTPRLIASEPTAHQWMQQGVRHAFLKAIDRSMLRKSIHFKDQTYSQRGALQASAQGHGCTIDLSSASDRLSCWTVERMFRKNHSFLRQLHATRTRWLVNDIDKKQSQFIELRKFAPMGSALTFPVQSVVYAIVAIACIAIVRFGLRENKLLSNQTMRSCIRKASLSAIVFGDDIIVPEDSYPLVSKVLSYLGLKVNTDKTFVGGFFYESCGVDAYGGVDVTPQYFLQRPVESDPSSITSTVETSNNFHKGGLWVTAAWLVALIPSKFRNFIGIDDMEDGTFGLKSYCGRFNTTLKERWNEQTQQWEQLRLWVKTAQKRSPDQGIGALLQYFTEEPGPEVKWVSGIAHRGKITLVRRYG